MSLAVKLGTVLNLGLALAASPFQAPAGEPWKLTGCLRAIAGHYMLTDDVTNVTVEVAGSVLDRESGNRVEVTGLLDPTTPPISGATHFIRVSRVKRLSKNCAPANKAAPGNTGRLYEFELRPGTREVVPTLPLGPGPPLTPARHA